MIENEQKNKKEDITFPGENRDVFSLEERWLYLCLIILFVVFVRVTLLEIPLERDEGEYAYAGQLLLEGIPPYSMAYNMKLPGTYLMYAGIMSVFGQSIQAIHLGLMALNCATILLLFYLTRRISNDFTAIIASGTYAILSLSSSVLGFAAHATHFVVLPAIGGAILLLSALEKNRLYLFFLSGAVFGLAFIMKQPGFFFFMFGALYILYDCWHSKPRCLLKTVILNFTLFVLGALLPFLVTVTWFYFSGVFEKFWFWTVLYAAKYASQVPLSGVFDNFKYNFIHVVGGFYLLWIISAVGFITILSHRKLPVKRMFIILFALCSFLSICPGFYFRPHYFITLLPAISISAGILINYLNARGMVFIKSPHLRFITLVFFIIVTLSAILNQKDYFFKDDLATVSRKIYGANPFPESIEIAKFIEAGSSRDDRIAVLGSEPQIYFYSKRRSATGYIYTYSLMENHKYSLSMQKEMLGEIESSKPKYLIDVRIGTSWLMNPNSEKFIFSWLKKLIKSNYHLVGIIDIISPELTIYKWNDDAKTYSIKSKYHVIVYEKV